MRIMKAGQTPTRIMITRAEIETTRIGRLSTFQNHHRLRRRWVRWNHQILRKSWVRMITMELERPRAPLIRISNGRRTMTIGRRITTASQGWSVLIVRAATPLTQDISRDILASTPCKKARLITWTTTIPQTARNTRPRVSRSKSNNLQQLAVTRLSRTPTSRSNRPSSSQLTLSTRSRRRRRLKRSRVRSTVTTRSVYCFEVDR